LKKLNCSGNKLTSFNLGDCQNLVELKCDNNPNLSQDLKVLVYLKELKYLDVSNCPFEGSLKPLESLSKLEQLNIGNTSLKEGLEYLPESCKKIYCNSNYPHQSTKIMEELDKSRCLVEEKEGLKSTSKKYYSLDKWRTDKQNSITASTIPLERLFVIRSNLKQFLNK